MKNCPVCKSHLSLKQINFTTAVYICTDLKCPYPVGYSGIEVTRSYKDMNKEVRVSPLPDDDDIEHMDDWMQEIQLPVETKVRQEPEKKSAVNFEDEINISDMIDETIKDCENAATKCVNQLPDLDFDDILGFMDG